MSRAKSVVNNKGFTIIELMVATLVFSVILVIITSGIIALTNQYYKGITSTKTQAAARAIMDTVAQDIQLAPSGGVSPSANSTNVPGMQYFCTGTHVYSFLLGKQLVDSAPVVLNQSQHVFVQSQQTSGCADPSSFPPVSSANRELLTPGMRLTKLSVQPITGLTNTNKLWQINVRVDSGDDDLFTVNPPNDTSVCKGGAGSQFCAVSELTTTVEERL
jgi:prepilin-type N-terminal cleavage/methylation domain-containing protein